MRTDTQWWDGGGGVGYMVQLRKALPSEQTEPPVVGDFWSRCGSQAMPFSPSVPQLAFIGSVIC